MALNENSKQESNPWNRPVNEVARDMGAMSLGPCPKCGDEMFSGFGHFCEFASRSPSGELAKSIGPPLSQAQLDAFEARISFAVAAERERCAKIADGYMEHEMPNLNIPGTDIPRGAQGWEAEEIAARIRSGAE